MDSSGFTQDPRSRLFVPGSLAQKCLGDSREPSNVVAAPAPVPGPVSMVEPPPRLLEPLGWAPGPLVTLFSAEALDAAHEKNRTQGPRSKSDREQIQLLLRHLYGLGTLRQCVLPENWEQRLEQLKVDHANFSQVVELVQREFALAEASEQPARVPPILLDGPPGCGKTYFAEALSKVMGTGFLRVNLETGQTPSELTGTAAHWGNSQPGRLFDLLVNGDHANPVVLLDEVDKAGGHQEHRIDRALYSLLDPGSAKEWADASLPSLKMDLRHVIWILTSNDWRLVPTPLLSRMQVFQVREPSRREAMALVRRIFESTALEFHLIEFSSEISTPLATMLALYPLRVVHRLCRALIAAAVRDERKAVEAKDLATVGADRAALDAFLAAGGETSPTRH